MKESQKEKSKKPASNHTTFLNKFVDYLDDVIDVNEVNKSEKQSAIVDSNAARKFSFGGSDE